MAYHISQAAPKTEKKFLQTKPTYRPNHRSEEGGIALPAPPPGSPPASPRPAPWAPSPPVQNPKRCKITLSAYKKAPSKAVRNYSLTYSAPNTPPAPPRPAAAVPPPSLPVIPHQLPAICPAVNFFRFFSACLPSKLGIFVENTAYITTTIPCPQSHGHKSAFSFFFFLIFPPLRKGGKLIKK